MILPSRMEMEKTVDQMTQTNQVLLLPQMLVINATGTSGVAGAWKTALEGKGYTSVEVGTYTQSAIATSKVCVSGSYDGADLAAELTSPEMSTVDSLSASDCDVSIDGYDIIVIIGTSDIKN